MITKNLPFVVLLGIALFLPAWVLAETGATPDAALATGGRLSPEILISEAASMPQADRYAPDVAANYVRGEYLVVWHNKWPDGRRDVYARRVSGGGRPLSWFAITTGASDRLQPAAAFNAADAEYLVVWMQDASGTGTQYEIWGRIVAWDGSYQKPEFKIISWPGRSMWTPRVVYNHNRNQYLVVRSAFDTTTKLATDVSSMLLDNKGNLLQGRVLTTSTYPHQADVAYGWATDEYLVVFVRSYTQATTGNDIYGLRVSAANAVVSPPGVITIHSGPQNQNAPRVASDGKGDYMVIWEYEFQPTDRDIHARRMKQNGQPDGAKFTVSNWPQDESNPVVVASFGSTPEYLAVWQRVMAQGTALAATRWGDALDKQRISFPEPISYESVKPAVDFARPNYLIASEGDSTGNPMVSRQIYGRIWAPYAAWLPVMVR